MKVTRKTLSRDARPVVRIPRGRLVRARSAVAHIAMALHTILDPKKGH